MAERDKEKQGKEELLKANMGETSVVAIDTEMQKTKSHARRGGD